MLAEAADHGEQHAVPSRGHRQQVTHRDHHLLPPQLGPRFHDAYPQTAPAESSATVTPVKLPLSPTAVAGKDTHRRLSGPFCTAGPV